MNTYSELLKFIPTEALVEEVRNRRAADLLAAIFEEELKMGKETIKKEVEKNV